jgi:hypothetical protein
VGFASGAVGGEFATYIYIYIYIIIYYCRKKKKIKKKLWEAREAPPAITPYEEEDTCMSYEEEDICTGITASRHEEEDTCVSIHMRRRIYVPASCHHAITLPQPHQPPHRPLPRTLSPS